MAYKPSSHQFDLTELLDDDAIISIFETLFTHHRVCDAISFLKTCKGVNSLMHGSGKPYYIEAKAATQTRMPVRVTGEFPFTEQVAAEQQSKNRVFGFYRASEMLAVHCATDCCEQARRDFNTHYARKYGKLDTVASGVRLIASAADVDANFILCREQVKAHEDGNSRKPVFRTVIRKYTGADGADTGTVTTLLLQGVGAEVIKLLPSPTGELCAFAVVNKDNSMDIMVWDTVTGLAVPLPVHPDLKKAGIYYPQCAWWVRRPDGSHSLFTAWHGRYVNDVCGGFQFEDDANSELPLTIVDYGKSVAEMTATGPFLPPTSIVESLRGAYTGRMQGVDGNIAVFYTDSPGNVDTFKLALVDCAGGRQPIYACTYSPFQLFPTPRLNDYRDRITEPAALAVSPNGFYIAVLAKNYLLQNYRGITKCIFLCLYTYDKPLNAFVKKLGPKDQLAIPVGPTQQREGWEALFSPCGAYVAIVYGRNRYKPHRTAVVDDDDDDDKDTCNVAESAVHVIHLSPKGLRRAKPSDCPMIRQIAWTRSGLLIAPKHGAVQLH